MNAYKFGRRSLKKLNTAHPDLIAIMTLAISRTRVDFGISEGYRTIGRQFELFLAGKSKIDGYKRKGKHNEKPSLAVDIYTYHPDYETRQKLAYDKVHLAYIAGVVIACAQELYQAGQITHLVRWGANWDKDGVIDFDQKFDDYPHFEIYKPG